ncbi:MAG: hypothetical protein WCK58_14510 [Chloroflexota bacterium]
MQPADELGDAFGGLPALGEDPWRTADCGSCGWGGAASGSGTCPRCGAVSVPEMPSADEVRAARRVEEG